MSPNLRSIEADPANIKPLGDFVLVKKISDLEGMYKGVIYLPPHKQTAEVDWVPQIGVVVTCGPGDAMIAFMCSCGKDIGVEVCFRLADSVASKGFPRCRECNQSMEPIKHSGGRPRALMHVSVGDKVIYQRWPDNDVKINGEEYTFLHEEQAVLAVLEREMAA